MGITRKSLFGFPPRPNQGSEYTQREVPLSQGVSLDQPWPAAPPGSAASMANFWPLDGVLIPRSRLSSLNTIKTLLVIRGMSELIRADGATPNLAWLSDSTRHALLTSNGSVSVASFVSAFGLGVNSLPLQTRWQYTQAFDGTLNENMLLATGLTSHDTVLAIYQTGGSSAGAPLYSYLTSAPKAKAIGVFDNYVIAWNVKSGSVFAPTRVQWCVRGLPSDWTHEGSGFEDLLAMRGLGTAVVPVESQRFYLFTDIETWVGVGAAYPAQFTFQPHDTAIGCPFPTTIAKNCEAGIIFLGSDLALRLLPRDGGRSVVVAPSLSKYLRRSEDLTSVPSGVRGWFDPFTGLYHLHGTIRDIVVNVFTGEWGFSSFPDAGVSAGLAVASNSAYGGSEGLLVASNSTVCSTSSLRSIDFASIITSTWQSQPIAADLPGNWKQLTEVDIDYRATSLSTITLKVSQDGGNTFESSGRSVILSTAAVAGRATSRMYVGGAFPTIEITSTSTGYELHRLDIGMTLGGRKSG